MKIWKKRMYYIINITLVLSMVSPVVLPIGVSATANKIRTIENIEERNLNQVNDLNENNHEEIEVEVEDIQDSNVNDIVGKDINSNELNGKTVEVEPGNKSNSIKNAKEENTDENSREYFSLEKNRKTAIEMIENEEISSEDSTMEQFIANISVDALATANKYDLSASVLIANAALESSWGTSVLVDDLNSFNLFGIRAEEATDKFVKENVKRESAFESVNFKKYTSFEESFLDYGKNFKSNSNLENENMFENTINLISEQYADKLEYKEMLNNIIHTYNLIRFDTLYSDKEIHKVIEDEDINNRQEKSVFSINKKNNIDIITSERGANYKAKIKRKTDNITTKPYGIAGYKTISRSSNYYGKEVSITKEAVTGRATWAFISGIGWIDKAGLNIETVLSNSDKNYDRRIGRKTDSISTLPWGTEGYRVIGTSVNYFGKQVKVIKEAKTRRATWALITINGKELGWIDKTNLTDSEVILSERAIKYKAKINRKTDNITTKPYGTEGYTTLSKSSKYYGKEMSITKEATTERATWAFVSGLGWIDKAGLDIEKVLSMTDKNYSRIIGRKTDSISTLPWGTEGYRVIGTSANYFGKQVKIIKEAETRRASWVLITVNGKELGWIDKTNLTDGEVILSERAIKYKAKINRKTDNITTKPYGTKGYTTLSKSSKYYGKEMSITKEAVTNRATWAFISGLGWIDKAGLNIETIISQKNINFKAQVIRSTDTINTVPWGTPGYKTVAHSKNYFGGEVTVTKEAKTRRATWVLVSFNGKQLGWIDSKAIKKINPSKKVVVIDPGHGGKDPGAQAGGVRESDLNLKVAKKMKIKLEKSGYEVVMTRTTDKFLELSEIAKIANRTNADIFVSVHTNSFNGSANGIETFSYNKAGRPNNLLIANDPKRLLNSSILSQSIQGSLIKETKAFDRKAKKENFHVIRETGMPAVLVEIGFVDNARERKKLVSNSYQEKLATGIVQGIQTYFKTFK